MLLTGFPSNSCLFMAHDCQRQHWANNVTRVTGQGRAGRNKYGNQTLNNLKVSVLKGKNTHKSEKYNGKGVGKKRAMKKRMKQKW